MKSLYFLVAVLIVGAGGQAPDTASVRGKIVFGGAIPVTPPANMAADPYCASISLPQEKLEDVIVYARPLGQPSFPVPASPVILERHDCRSVPHTLTIQVGQKLLMRNSDRTAHNFHAWPTTNTSFNVALARTGSESEQVFQKEESPFPIRDDIHNWESAYVGVFSHPYHVVSKLNGAYEFRLPAGVYEIGVWHEKLGKQTHTFGVMDGEFRELDFTFK